MTWDHVAVWLHHPLTVAVVVLGAVSFQLMTEVLLRCLSDLGNVRFQGILEDHPALVPSSTGEVHLSSIQAALRWLQAADLGLLWLALWSLAVTSPLHSLLASILVPAAVVLVAQRLAGQVSEPTVAFLLRLLRPLTSPLVHLVARHAPSAPPPPPEEEEEMASDREIQAFLDVGHAAGIIEGEEGEILESLVEFFSTTVREVMTPRTDMVALPDDVDFATLLEVFASSHRSRIPIYSGTIDNVVGVVHVKNLVADLRRGERPAVTELMHDCLVVPESKGLGELLRDFQVGHQQMAIVVDEYGGTSGLVTLEDILEEIVGEIQDELDPRRPPECQELEPGVYRLQGRASVEVLEELFEVEVDEEDMDTVGGLVFDRHGTVPSQGTVVDDEITRLRFVVEEVAERRVVSVTVRRLPEPEESPS